MAKDSFGIQGMVASYALIFFFIGIAFIFFLYLWWKGRLDMDEEPKHQMLEQQEVEYFGEPLIASKDEAVPKWLLTTYIVMPIIGLVVLFLYWNGSWGWLDRGYWGSLQKAANTTFPEIERAQDQFNSK